MNNYTDPDEIAYSTLETFVKLINPTSYLEIGTREGKSLLRVLKSDSKKYIKHLCICDTWGGEYGGSSRGNHNHIVKMLSDFGYQGTVEYLDGDSKILLPTATGVFDLIFVDGDHSDAGCMIDMTNSLMKLKLNGIMVIDDIIHGHHLWLKETVTRFIVNNYDKIEIEFFDALTYHGVAVLKRKWVS